MFLGSAYLLLPSLSAEGAAMASSFRKEKSGEIIPQLPPKICLTSASSVNILSVVNMVAWKIPLKVLFGIFCLRETDLTKWH